MVSRSEKVSVPLRMFYKGNVPPGYPTEGTMWYKEDEKKVYIYDGSKWKYVFDVSIEQKLEWTSVNW